MRVEGGFEATREFEARRRRDWACEGAPKFGWGEEKGGIAAADAA